MLTKNFKHLFNIYVDRAQNFAILNRTSLISKNNQKKKYIAMKTAVESYHK